MADPAANSAVGWPWKPWLAGGIAGGSMAVVGHPFDTLKTRIQADKVRAFRSTLHCAKDMVGKEGAFALWRGIGPALLSTGLTGSIRFGIQSAANGRLAQSMVPPICCPLCEWYNVSVCDRVAVRACSPTYCRLAG